MVNSLLTADWHLTDAAAEEYRWDVFTHVLTVAKANHCQTVYICGDLTDKKDRHSAALVNRLIYELRKLLQAGLQIEIILGNHDLPLSGTAYWSSLNSSFGNNSGLRVIDAPQLHGSFILLPYSANPEADWSGIDFRPGKTVLMHQPCVGAQSGGHTLNRAPALPTFPRGVSVYSGDIHAPQKVGPVQYIGAPHPVSFGDEHECRMLVIDHTGKTLKIVSLPNVLRKASLRITCAADLEKQQFNAGDQVKITATIPLSQLNNWAVEEQAIKDWALKQHVTVASIIVNVEHGTHEEIAGQPNKEAATSPSEVLLVFAAEDWHHEAATSTFYYDCQLSFI